MCGRATLATPPEIVAELFAAEPLEERWPARYNIAPTQPVVVVRGGARRTLGTMRWGLVPSFARERSGAPMINARVESLEKNGMLRAALASRRCLVVVDGFYEWTHAKPRKIPHYVKRVDGRPMALAALWDRADPGDEEPLESCAVLTVAALPPVAAIHDRMPLLVAPELIDAWLDASRTTVVDLASVLSARPAATDLTSFTVDRRVNSALVDEPSNIEPFELQRTLFG